MDHPERRVLFTSLLVGVAIWLADALLDALFFYPGSLPGLLILQVPPHEIYVRSVGAAAVVAFGFVMSRLAARRRQADAALRESEAQYRMLVEHSLQGIMIVQREPLRISFANSVMTDILGYTTDELLALSPEGVESFIHPQDRPTVLGRLRRRLAGEAIVPHYEFRVVQKDGSQRWVEILSTRIEYKGQPAALVTFVDISERKRVEQEREQLITELQGALAQVKALSGLLPICSACKRIRDDEGYWRQLEQYISTHSEAQFTHGICPDCLRRLYPEYAEDEVTTAGE